jgi:hypothetical protein
MLTSSLCFSCRRIRVRSIPDICCISRRLLEPLLILALYFFLYRHFDQYTWRTALQKGQCSLSQFALLKLVIPNKNKRAKWEINKLNFFQGYQILKNNGVPRMSIIEFSQWSPYNGSNTS